MVKKKKASATQGWNEAILAARKAYGFTQVKAAETLGVAAVTWISWENGQRIPSSPSKRLLRLTFPGINFPK